MPNFWKTEDINEAMRQPILNWMAATAPPEMEKARYALPFTPGFPKMAADFSRRPN